MVGCRIAGLFALLVVFTVASPAWAQDAPTTPEVPPAPEVDEFDPNVAPPPGIEAIEVSGERLDTTDVQDEAKAVTAFSGADLDRASIVNVDSLQFNVPGLHVGQSGTAPIITLRGIGTENASLTGEPGVAFHIDGVNLSRPAAARVAFFDLESLDVKRGPQGLLGGKNSTSGSINLITKKPTDEYEISGDVLSGNYDRIRMRGMVNVPAPFFGEGSAARVAYFHEDRNGYLNDLDRGSSRNAFDAADRGGRAHFLWVPTETVNWLFSGNWFKQGGVGPQADVVPRRRVGYLCDRDFPVAVQRQLGNRTLWGRETRDVFADTDLLPSAACYKNKIITPQRTVPGWVEPGLGASTGFTPYRDPVTGDIVKDVRTGEPLPVQIRQQEVNGVRTTRFNQQTLSIHQPASEDADPREIHVDVPSEQDNLYWGWSSTLDWDAPELPLLGESQVKLIGGFQHTGGDFIQDFDATDARLVSYNLDDEADQYSSELQWSGMIAERLEWQTSLFYLKEDAARDVEVPNLQEPSQKGVFIDQTTDNKSYGAALNNIYHATDDLRLSLGGRWIKDKRETFLQRYAPNTSAGRNTIFRGCNGNLDYTSGGDPNPPFTGDRPFFPNKACEGTFRGTMWGTGADWRPFGGDHLLYAKLDRGYKSGGFQAGTVGNYKPEKIWAYALGSKSEFFDQRLTVNLEGFFYAYQDLQLVVLDGFALRTENTDARMHGFDLEANATPIEGLNLGVVISFLKTETRDYFSIDPTTEPPAADINEATYATYQNKRLTERENAEALHEQGDASPLSIYANRECFAGYSGTDVSRISRCGDLAGTTGGLDDFSGNQLPRSPEWKYTLSAEYEVPLGRFGSLTPRVQYTWQDDTYFRAFNRGFDLQEDYHLTNAKLIWSSPEQTWSVEAFVENIEDEAPKQNILIGPRQIDAPPLVWYGPPRFYGFQVGFHY